MPLLGDEWTECRALAEDVKSFPSRPLIDRPGWNGCHFALADGTVFSPVDNGKQVVLFSPNASKCATSGTIAGWRRATRIVADQPIATFVLMTAFTGPLLGLTDRSMNQGFEIAGPKGIGKSTLQRLAAAVCGPADDPRGDNYWITANTTVNGLEQVMIEHQDAVMIIEETNLFAAGDNDKQRAAKLNELVFRLADGSVKRRHGDGPQQRYRFTFLTSTNEPLAKLLLGHRGAVSDAASDRLITIPIDDDRPFKVFDTLPPQFASGSAMAARLNLQIRKNHGTAIRHFVDRLVRKRAQQPGFIEELIEHRLAEFRVEAGVDLNDGSAVRVADAFGLVYAAGVIAVRCSAVSSALDPMRAAKTCYDLHRAAQADQVGAVDRLRSLYARADALKVDPERLERITDEQLERAPSIVRRSRGGRSELLLTRKQLERAFPVPRLLFDDPEAAKLLVAEEKRKQTKREIRRDIGPERFHCFRMDLAA